MPSSREITAIASALALRLNPRGISSRRPSRSTEVRMASAIVARLNHAILAVFLRPVLPAR